MVALVNHLLTYLLTYLLNVLFVDCRVHVCDWNESWNGSKDHG